MATPPNGGFGNVQIPEGFSEKELRWSYWFVTHREQVRKWAIAIFIAFDAAVMLFALWGFIDYLALNGLVEERAVRGLTAGFGLASPAAAQEIKLEPPIVFSDAGDRYDLVVAASNPNANYWVELTYKFTLSGSDTAEQSGFLLPGESKYLMQLGVHSDSHPGDIGLRVVRRAFHLVDAHAIPDYKAWSAPRLNITADDATFTPGDPSAPAPVGKSSFTLVNGTAYSYYDVNLQVLLYRGDTLVGVNAVRLSRLNAGASLPYDVYWYQSLTQVTRVEVHPEVNIFDPKAYKAPGA